MSMSSESNGGPGNSQLTPPAPPASVDLGLTTHQQVASIDPQVSTASSPSPTGGTWTPPSLQLDNQSQSNLRQASVALDAAYERISQLRSSINALLARVPPEVSGTIGQTGPQTSGRGLGPSHSALVLSGGAAGEDVVDELNLRAQRLRSLIPSSARQRLEDFESSTRGSTRREFVWDTFSQENRPRPQRDDGPQTQTSPLRPRTPPMPDLVIPRARNDLETRTSMRRDLYSINRDESSTMIGRRVAARVASGTTPEDRPSLAVLQQRLEAQSAQIARELENMTERLAPQRPRRSEHLVSLRGRGASFPTQDGLGPARSTGQSTLPPLVTPPSDISNDGASSPFSSNEHSARTWRNVVLIDNTEYHNPSSSFPRGTRGDQTYNAVGGHAIADSEEASTRTWATFRDRINTQEVQDNSRNVAPEHFFLSRAPEWERELSEVRSAWMSPPGPLPQAGQTRRRRGWTRLNADGDEISSEDEATHARRLRMRLANGTSVSDQIEARYDMVEDMHWRATGPYDGDSKPDGLSQGIVGVCDTVPFARSLLPNLRNPLPTPVEEMLTYPKGRQRKQQPPVRVITVSKGASLVGGGFCSRGRSRCSYKTDTKHVWIM
ncbi:hypothetical protein F5I97DRAFT_1896824 [Phlebopus sp. FC_14]|nr:hypothetical protein F5I97DRAFT_1896824 [Phlebopus sp. FC_14]